MDRSTVRRWVLGAALASAFGAAGALTSGTTPEGVAYVCGGVGREETAQMRSQFGSYDLWVTTAAQRSGRWLADAQVRISDSHDRVVFDQRLDGPWLLVKLPPGSYRVEATSAAESGHEPQHQTKTTTVSARGLRQLIFYFDIGDTPRPPRPAGSAAESPYQSAGH